ncbi:MAG TPA: phosphatase PAP2 family protein [Gemmatimonadaceae bacterium]|nr:phosphatase PAP2 family protein [Gemmatimonadaceae bacterium]
MWNRFAVLLLLTSLSARADAQRASDLEVGGAFMLSAVVLAPLDRRMHDFLTQPSLESNVALHRSANTISALILPGTAGIVLGTYIAGQVGHDRGLAEIGFHGGEAIFLGELVTGALKIAAGRSRPTKSPDDPYHFHPGRWLSHDDEHSFPSAHATAAFALAAVLSTESARWWHHAGWVGPVAYAGAGTAGAARIYLGKHWLSDVLAGAGIGIGAGLVVTHFSESHPHNALDRVFLP